MRNTISEVWKPVVGLESRYSISDQGRIRRDYSTLRRKAGVILKTHITPKGYHRIQLLRADGRTANKFVHQLVAEAFIGNSPVGQPQINHKDGNKLNNHPSNLEWVSPLENVKHAFCTGLAGRAGKLSDADVDTIRQLYANGGITHAQLAAQFSVGHTIIGSILTNKKRILRGVVRVRTGGQTGPEEQGALV